LGLPAYSLARLSAKSSGRKLVLDAPEETGFLETHCLDALVTDSGAAATAWSTGRLAKRKTIGHGKTGEGELLFERLRRAGRAFGFVTTTRVTHYTLSPFYAREDARDEEGDIAEQLVQMRADVALGGGRRHFLPHTSEGGRSDSLDLIAAARTAGFEVLETLPDSLPLAKPLLGLFAMDHLAQELDREAEPDLASMAVAAIRRLAATGKPWFLLVEEGRIDTAAHEFDAPSIVQNTIRLDRAVQAILGEIDPKKTLVVVVSDHATGSPSIHELARPDSFSVVTASVEEMERRIFGGASWLGTPESLEKAALPVLDECARHTGLSTDDLDRMLTARNVYERRAAIGKAISWRFGISFLPWEDYLAATAVHGHTGELVPIKAWGPRAGEIGGIRDHAELGTWLAQVLELPAPQPSERKAAEGAAGAR
jgi:alkaline phosphatase